MTHPLRSAEISIFNRKSTVFVVSTNTDTDCILIHNFKNFKVAFKGSLKVALINMVAILGIPAKRFMTS